MKSKYLVLSGFALKVIGLITMTFNHIGLFMQLFCSSDYQRTADLLIIIGRIAFPIFVLLLIEGMYYSKNKEKYVKRIGLLALTTVILHFAVYLYFRLQNVLFLIGGNPILELFLIALSVYFINQNSNKKWLSILPILYVILSFVVTVIERVNSLTILWFPDFLRCDYSLLGLLIAITLNFSRPILHYYVNVKKPYGMDLEAYSLTSEYRVILNLISIAFIATIVFVFWLVARYSTDASGFSYFDIYSMREQSYCLLSCIFIFLYNGERGYDSKKWRIFSYAYFPMHIVILSVIFVLIYGL